MPLPNGNPFAPTYPGYILVDAKSVHRNDDGSAEYVSSDAQIAAVGVGAGRLAFPVFTDGYLAEQFVRETGDMAAVAIIGVETAEGLAEMLERWRCDFDWVAFDPVEAGKPCPRMWDIDYAIEKIRAGDDL